MRDVLVFGPSKNYAKVHIRKEKHTTGSDVSKRRCACPTRIKQDNIEESKKEIEKAYRIHDSKTIEKKQARK